MSDRGFIVIDRALFSHWIWEERPLSKGAAWIDLIGLANYKTVKKTVGENVVTYKRGTVFRSILQLSKRWGWDRKKVTRFLRALESDKMVALNSTTQGTTITIVNYNKYQIDGTTKGTTDGTTSGQRLDNASPQEKEKISNENKDNNISNVCVSNNNIYNTRARDGANSHTPTSPTSTKIPTAAQVADRLIELGTSTNIGNFLEYNQARGWKTEWTYALDRWLEKDKARIDQNPGEVKKAFESERVNNYEEMERQLRRAQRRRAEGE